MVFCKGGDLSSTAKELFVSMSSKGYEFVYKYDVISYYTVLIYGYCKTLKVEEAMEIYNKMLRASWTKAKYENIWCLVKMVFSLARLAMQRNCLVSLKLMIFPKFICMCYFL